MGVFPVPHRLYLHELLVKGAREALAATVDPLSEIICNGSVVCGGMLKGSNRQIEAARVAITRHVSPRLVDCELTCIDSQPIDIERARAHGMDVGCICTFTPRSAARAGEVFDFFAHEGIGFVMVRSQRRGTVVLAEDGALELASGQVTGADPLAAFGRGAAEVLGGYMGDPIFKKVNDSAMASMRDTANWLSLADTPYVAQRTRVLSSM